jgi:hypothetical protein
MDYTLKYFGKVLDELQYSDIQNYFVEEREESEKIEFKAFSSQYGNFEKDIEGVIRAICAFLNSDGGLVIWGAPEGVMDKQKKVKVFQGELSPVKIYKDKDWLISKISDSITPLPIGIKVQIMQKGEDLLYIFEIQPSAYKPHQFKNTYWVRLDGQTKPAPHYLIESLFKQIKYPNIEGYLKLNKVLLERQEYVLGGSIMIFNFSKFQNEHNVGFTLTCVPGTILGRPAHIVKENFVSILHFGTPLVFSFNLVLDPYELIESNYKVEIVLTFGGKQSPVKASYYSLDLTNIQSSVNGDLNYLIKEISENELLSERQERKGNSKEKTLKMLLGR